MSFFQNGPQGPSPRRQRQRREQFHRRKRSSEGELIQMADRGYEREAAGQRARTAQDALQRENPQHFVTPHQKLVISLLLAAFLAAAYFLDSLMIRQVAQFLIGQSTGSSQLAAIGVWAVPAAIIVAEVWTGWRLAQAWRRRDDEDGGVAEVLEWTLLALVTAAVVPSALVAVNTVANYPARTPLLAFQVCLSSAMHFGVILGANLTMQAAHWWGVRVEYHWRAMKAHGAEREVLRLETQTRSTTMNLAQMVEEAGTVGLSLIVGPLPGQTIRWIGRCFERNILGSPSGPDAAGGPTRLPPAPPRTPPPNGAQAEAPGAAPSPPEPVDAA